MRRATTNELIEDLARDLAPVEPLSPPWARAAVFLLGAVLYFGLVAHSMSGTWSNMLGTRFPAALLSALVASALAAVAAFASVVPGYPKRVLVWALVAGVVWLCTLLTEGLQQFDAGVILGARHEWLCVATIVAGGTPLLGVLATMLRRGVPLNPALTGSLAAIAVGALADVLARVSQPHGNDITLMWHGGAIVGLVLACICCARFVLTWHSTRQAVVVMR